VPDKFLNLLDGIRRLPPVDHCVAIRADWPQVQFGIDPVIRSDAREFLEVMDVDETGNHLPVPGYEVEAADITDRSETSDACLSGVWVTFVSIDQDLLHAAFAVARAFWYVLW
jgi:hypothetical protein